MPTTFWNPDDWQQTVNLWLRTRHLSDYQKVPDKHVGDFGIEGFSTDGNVYQAYAPDAMTTTLELYEKQRDKITKDISKFCANRTELAKMFGTMKVRRWILTVPSFDSALLVQHAATKTKEVLDLNLPYVAEDFRVLVFDEDDFAVERAKVLSAGLHQLQVNTVEPSIDVVETWTQTNATFVVTATEKLQTLVTEPKREKFVHELARLYVRGETTLLALDNDYPTIANSARRIKAEREQTLEAESLISNAPSTARLGDVRQAFAVSLHDQIPGMSLEVAERLAWEATADWIFRCPLSF